MWKLRSDLCCPLPCGTISVSEEAEGGAGAGLGLESLSGCGSEAVPVPPAAVGAVPGHPDLHHRQLCSLQAQPGQGECPAPACCRLFLLPLLKLGILVLLRPQFECRMGFFQAMHTEKEILGCVEYYWAPQVLFSLLVK